MRLVDVVAEVLAAQRDPRAVVADAEATYLGSVLNDRTLLPADDAWVGPTAFADWLHRTVGAGRATAPR